MSRTRFFSLCVLVLLGAFAGGYVANRSIPVAHAQVIQVPGKVSATAVTLVSEQGKVQATLRGGASGAELILDDSDGHARVTLGVGGIAVHDATGRLVWASPRGTGVFPAGER